MGDEPDPHSRARGAGERRLWWTAFGLLTLACSAWGLSLPLMTGPDESSHAIRAAAVARGQLGGSPLPEWGNSMVEVRVPEAYGRAGAVGPCFMGEPREWFGSYRPNPGVTGCPELAGGAREVTAPTTEHRGEPIYYLAVGLPTLVFPGAVGAHLMRLVGAVLCSALLASAAVSVLRLRGNLLAPVGVLAALTPAVLYFAGTVNSIGLEIAAALALWSAGAAIVRAPHEPDGRLVARAGVALVVLVLSRGLSPAFGLLALIVLAVAAGPDRRRRLVRRGDVRLWLTFGAAAMAAAGGWLVYVHDRFPVASKPGWGLGFAVADLRWDLRELVGVFGSTDVVPPAGVHLAWAAVVVAVFGLAWRRGARGEAALAAAVGLVAVGLHLSGEGFSIPDTGFWWQGRYVMPAAIGAPVIASLAPRGRRPAPGAREAAAAAARPHADVDRSLARIAPVLLAVLVAVHAWCFLYALRHYTVGHEGPANPVTFLLHPDWSPPLAPPVVWVAALVGAVGGLAVVVWRAATTGVVPSQVLEPTGLPGWPAVGDEAGPAVRVEPSLAVDR